MIKWIRVPIDISKTKNLDIGKLLFMGYVSENEQKNLIDKIIDSLEEEYMALKKLRESIHIEKERETLKNYLLIDIEYQKRIKNLNKENDISENIKEISKFTLTTLDYGIDITAFNIEWFKKLKKRV